MTEITYDGGVATALAAPPEIPGPGLTQLAEPKPQPAGHVHSVSGSVTKAIGKPMREKEPQFTVTDRRKFTSEGELREGAANESSPPPAAAERTRGAR